MATIFNRPSFRENIATFDNYPVGVPRRLSYPDLPAWGLLQRAADLIPGRLACHYNDLEWTWEELNADAIRAAAAFRRLGVSPGDRVGILLPNIPEYVIALNGIWRAGGIAVALSPLAVPEEIDRMLAATDCRYVVCLDMLTELISGPHRPDKALLVSLRPRLPLFQQLGYLFLRRRRTGYWWMSANEHVGWFWEELLEAGPPPIATGASQTSDVRAVKWPPVSWEGRNPSEEVSEAKLSSDKNVDRNSADANWDRIPAYILPTGGTTGEPKAVTLSHRNMVANAWQQFYWAGGAIGKETLLSVLPFFHSYGLSTNVMGGTAMIASMIMDHRFKPSKVLQLIERHRPTVFHAVPAMLKALNDELDRRDADLSSLKWVISGGAPLPIDVAEKFAQHTGALVVAGYGLSEASPVTHVGPLDQTATYGSIGLPLPDTDCRVVDSQTGDFDVAAGEIGELLVRGPQVMLGYWHEIRHDFLRHGRVTAVDTKRWLPTGDLVRQNSAGHFLVVERKKDLIITSGFNVYPQEVESALRQHPIILDAAVVGIPDADRGELVKAFVTIANGQQWNESAIRRHCESTLSAHKRPRRFEVCHDDLPRSFLGKVVRRKLRSTDQQAAPSSASNEGVA
ncbi:MAG: hypothetical protein Fues2KO_42260 [Fuerstiella sp.]